MHDNINKFYLRGTIGDSNMVESKERLVFFLENQMRDYGYVPVLDLEPQFTLDYMPETEQFEFEITVYGVEKGKDKSWQLSGVMNGTEIRKHTPKSKLKQ